MAGQRRGRPRAGLAPGDRAQGVGPGREARRRARRARLVARPARAARRHVAGRGAQDREERHDADDREPDEDRRRARAAACPTSSRSRRRRTSASSAATSARRSTRPSRAWTSANLSGRYGPFLIAGAEAVVEPYADSGPTPMNHPGEELVIVTEGAMEFTVGGEERTASASATRSTSARCSRTPGATRTSCRRARSGSSSARPDYRGAARAVMASCCAAIRTGELAAP